MGSKVIVHIGAPKTGTTYIQDRLHQNAATLAAHGVVLPTIADTPPTLFHFRAALDLVGAKWGGPGAAVEGAWDHLVERVHAAEGTVIISHEVLASAGPAAIARAKRTLTASGAELHVVYGARDMWRQVSAGWQEEIKQGKTWSFEEYCSRLREGQGFFALPFDLPRVIDGWAKDLRPEHVHVVTVAQERRGDELWERACAGLQIDPSWAPDASAHANPSLGAAETTVLRALNERLGRDSHPGQYDDLVRQLIAEQALAERDRIPIIASQETYDWAADVCEEWIAYLARRRRIDVIGEVGDLRPAPRPTDAPDADAVDTQAQLAAAVDALAATVREAEQRGPRMSVRAVARRMIRRLLRR
ncbi:hypothetical protein [Microbacterium sp. G2-8]|uniref:hypothetical protein n=1 Tax=Microbacterium sp. G2-8 TaxID=2842454 RepID=UPI001C892AA5|nr:hypothetical protein [Microbacterium sp. G2-8]